MKYSFSFFFILIMLFSWCVVANAQDTVAPTVTITTDDADNLVNAKFEATIAFSEDVNNFVESDITVTGGTTSNFTKNTDDEYTVDITPSSSGTLTIQVPANAATDGDGNGNAAGSKTVTADLDPPTVTITDVPSTTMEQNSAFNVTITFSENVTGFDKDDLTVNGEATATAVTGSDKDWTATITPNADKEGDITLQVSAGGATDAAGNGNTASAETSEIHIDTIPPTVASISGVPTIEKNVPFDITITFSEAVNDFQANNLTITGPATASLKSGSDGDTQYILTITPDANAEGDVTFQVPVGAAKDFALNNNIASEATDSVYIDTIPPTVEITNVPTIEKNVAFDVTIAFSETVNGFTLADIERTGPATVELKSGSDGDTEYIVTVTPNTNAEDDVTLQVLADAVKDTALNNNSASNQAQVHIDTIPPTVSIDDVPTTEQKDPFDITVTFSEGVNGFAVPTDLAVPGPASASLTSGSDGDAVYVVTVTPDATSEGDVTLQVLADAVKDFALNDNTASAVTNTIHIDTIPPTVSISGLPDIEKNVPFDLTITFSEAVNGFEAPEDLTLRGPASASLKSGSDGDTVYVVTITPAADAEGDVTLQVKAGAARDPALNDNTVSAETDAVHIDTIPPTVSISGLPDIEKNEPFDLTITFSEAVNGFAVPEDLTVTGPITLALVAGSDGDSEYRVTVTPDSDAEDDVTVHVNAGIVTDFALNSNSASNQAQVRIDTIVPTVELIDVPEDVQLEIFSVTIAYSEDVREFELEDIILSGDAVVVDSELTGTGSTYTLTITPHEDTDGDVTIEVPADVAEDEATNPNTASAPQTVSVAPKWIPDPNIRVAIRRSLELAVGEDFSQNDILDLVQLDADGFEIIDLTGLEYATNLSVANLAENEIVDISPLEDLTQLRTLDLGNNSIIDISPLENLFELETLILANNSIEEIFPLSGLTNLITLDISYNDVSDVSALADFVALAHLDLTRNQIQDISPIVGLESLEVLRVSENPILDVKPLAGLTAVIEVDGEIPELISDPGLAEAVRKALGLDAATDMTIVALQRLTTLEAPPSNIRTLAGLELATALTTLKISRNVITDLMPLSELTNLTTLELNDNLISDLTPIAELTNLTTLELSGNSIRNLTPLTELTQLTTLKLNSNTISDLSSVSHLTMLTTLEIGDNAIEALTSLAALQALTTLNLSGNSISELTPLAGMITLTILDFSSNAIENIDVLGGLTGVTLLNLSGNSISDLTPLAELTRLTTLRLSNNSINDLRPLASLTNLSVLALNANSITDISVLGGLTLLSTLTLGDNSIRDLTPLASLTQLKVLNLSGNDISNLNFLTPLTLLRTLDLTFNDISDVAPVSELEDLLILRLVGNPILDTTPLYPLTQRVPPVDIDIVVSQFRPWDVNADSSVNATDVALVAAALGQTGESIVNPRTDVNGDGKVDNTDLSLVNEHLDDAAAAPSSADMPISLDKTLLLANYPNPFNPETWIPYQLANNSDVWITIYDARGVIIRHLKLGYKPAGYYTEKHRAAYWDGRNAVGERVASGVYYYRLQADKISPMRKMLILK